MQFTEEEERQEHQQVKGHLNGQGGVRVETRPVGSHGLRQRLRRGKGWGVLVYAQRTEVSFEET